MSIWIVPLGLLVGVTLGALGGGGAILTVPILVYLLGQSPRAATAGSLIIVGLTSIAGLLPHRRAGRVRVAEGVVFGVLGVVGSVLGSRLSATVSPALLMSAFAVLMLVVAGLMTRGRRQQQAGPGAAKAGPTPAASMSLRPLRLDPRSTARLVTAATGVGLVTGFFGVGGGFAVVPALVLALGFGMPAAVGTSLLVIVINSATALVSRLGSGVEVDWTVILTFSVFGAIGSLFGGRLAQRVDPRHLNLAFTVLLVLVAGYVAAMNIPALFRVSG